MSAHPLVVAVAMGLLPAHALAGEGSDPVVAPGAGHASGEPAGDDPLDEAVVDTLLAALRVEAAGSAAG